MADRPAGPLLYTLFPRLAGTLPQWLKHSARAQQLGFSWIHLNPIQATGTSKSLYSIKDFYSVDPDFIPEGCEDPSEELSRTLDAMHQQGLRVLMDLVVNHTAIDSPLVEEHPTWFRRDQHGSVASPSAIDPADARNVTVWVDLAQVDNAHSADRQELWAYWTAMVQYYLDLGFDGFRCDAAYKVPAPLWKHLIGAGRRRNPEVVFAAETLGCRSSETRALATAGFDYLFNSSKWWQFDEQWCLKQHEEFGRIAPSISFPETHDTARVMAESDGRVQVQKQRYAFAAAFSAGLLMPIGYEYCARRALHVVKTRPEHWEEVHDLCAFIRRVNHVKQAVPVMHQEGHWITLSDLNSPTVVLRKRADGCRPLIVAINKDWHHGHDVMLPDPTSRFDDTARVLRVCKEQALSVEPWPRGNRMPLEPAEVVYIVSRQDLMESPWTSK